MSNVNVRKSGAPVKASSRMFIYIPEDTSSSTPAPTAEDTSSSGPAPTAEDNNESTLLFEPEDEDDRMKNEYDKLKDIASSLTNDIVHDYKIPEINNTSHFASTEKFVNDSFKANDDDDLIAKYLATFNKDLKDKKTSDLSSRSPSAFDDSKHDRNDELNAEDHVIADIAPDTPMTAVTPVTADAVPENNTQTIENRKESTKRVILLNDSNVEFGSGEDNAVKTLLLVKPEDQSENHDNKDPSAFHTDVYLWHDDPVHAKQRSEKNNITYKEVNNLFDYINKQENSTASSTNTTATKADVQTPALKPSIHNQVHNLISDLLTLDKSVDNPSLVGENKSANEGINRETVSEEGSTLLNNVSLPEKAKAANETDKSMVEIVDRNNKTAEITTAPDVQVNGASKTVAQDNAPSPVNKQNMNTAADFASTIQKIDASNTAAINALNGASNVAPVTGANSAPNVLVNPSPKTEASSKKTDTLILFDNDNFKKNESNTITNKTSKSHPDDDGVFANCAGLDTNTDDPEDEDIGGRFHTFLGDILLPCQKEISSHGHNATIAQNASTDVIMKAESLPNNPESNDISEHDNNNEDINDRFQSMNLNAIVKNKDLLANQKKLKENSNLNFNSNTKHKVHIDSKHKANKHSNSHKKTKKIITNHTHQKSSKELMKKKISKKTKAVLKHATKPKKIQHSFAAGQHKLKPAKHKSGKTRTQVHTKTEEHAKHTENHWPSLDYDREFQKHAKRVILNHDAEIDNKTNKVLYTIQLSDSDEKKIQKDGNNTVLMISVTGNDKNIMSSNVKVLKQDAKDGSATQVAESNKDVKLVKPEKATLLQQSLKSSEKDYDDYIAQYKKKLTVEDGFKMMTNSPHDALMSKGNMAQKVVNSSNVVASSSAFRNLTMSQQNLTHSVRDTPEHVEHQKMASSHENDTTKTLNHTTGQVKINSTSNIYKLIQLTNDLTDSVNATNSSKSLTEHETQKYQSSASRLKELKELIEQVRNELNVENNVLKQLNETTIENNKKHVVNAESNVPNKSDYTTKENITNENATNENATKESTKNNDIDKNLTKENVTQQIGTTQNATQLNDTKAELIKNLTHTIQHIITNHSKPSLNTTHTKQLSKPKMVHIDIKSHHTKNTTQINKPKKQDLETKIIHKLTPYHNTNKTKSENILMYHKQQNLANKSHALYPSLTTLECDHEENPSLTPDADKENEAKVHAMQWEVFSLVDTKKKEQQQKKKKKCQIKRVSKAPKKDIHVLQKNYQKQKGKVNSVLNSFDHHLMTGDDNAHQKFRSNTSNDDIDSDYIGNQAIKMQNDPFDPLPESNLQKVHYRNQYNNPQTTKDSDLSKDNNCEGGTCKNNVPSNEIEAPVPDGYDENNQHLLKYLNNYVNKDNLYQTTDKLTHMFNNSHEDVNAAIEAAEETDKGANKYMTQQPIEVGGHEIDPDLLGMESKGKLVTKVPKESEEKKKIATNPGDTEYLGFGKGVKENNEPEIVDKDPPAIKEDHYRDPEAVTPDKINNFKEQHNDLSQFTHVNKSFEENDAEPKDTYDDTVTAADTINNEQYGDYEKAKEIFDNLDRQETNNLYHTKNQNEENMNHKENDDYNGEYKDEYEGDEEKAGPPRGAPKVDSVQMHVIDNDVSDTKKTTQNEQVNQNIESATNNKDINELQHSSGLDRQAGLEYQSSYLQTNPGSTVLDTNQQNTGGTVEKLENHNFDRQGDVSVKAVQIDSPDAKQNQVVQSSENAQEQSDPMVVHSDNIENQRPFTNFERMDSSVNQIPSEQTIDAPDYVDGSIQDANEGNPDYSRHKSNRGGAAVQDKEIEIPLTKDIDEKALEQQQIVLNKNEDSVLNTQSQSNSLVFEPYHEDESTGGTNVQTNTQPAKNVDAVKNAAPEQVYGVGTAQHNEENAQTGDLPMISDGENSYLKGNELKAAGTTQSLHTARVVNSVRKPVLALTKVKEPAHIQLPKTSGEPPLVSHEKDDHGFLKENNPTSHEQSYNELGDLIKEKSGLDFLTDDIDQLDREITQSKEAHIKGAIDDYKPSIIDLESTKTRPNVELVSTPREQAKYASQTPPRPSTIALQKTVANLPTARKVPIRKTLQNFPVHTKTYTIVKKPVNVPVSSINTLTRPRIVNRVAAAPARLLAKQRPQLPRNSMLRYTAANTRPAAPSLTRVGGTQNQNIVYKAPAQKNSRQLTVEAVPSREAVEDEVTESYPEESNLPDTNEFHPVISVSGTSAPVVHIQ